MKQSQLFGKTKKYVDRDIHLKSHELLLKAGFIQESSAGRYYFLPLGLKVRDKIVEIIEQEMNALGAQKIITPVLHPIELWQETNRTSTVGFELMTIKDRRGSAFALGGTAEEMMVDLVRKYSLSYRDLPLTLYQFSQKFRDELRARGGLLRVREFLMKDAYSFHADEKCFQKTYQAMKKAYQKIFKQIKLPIVIVEADNGYIGGEYCHEVIVESAAGESRYLSTQDQKYLAHQDVAEFKRQAINPQDKPKTFKIIDQPEWVQSIEQMSRHYQLPKSRFLKNVVYKNTQTGQIIIAVIRGDLEVNQNKLEQHLNAIGQLAEADDQDLRKINTKPGYVHSWGHKATYIGDLSLKTVINFIGGQKNKTTDSYNVNYGRDFTCDQLADIAVAKQGYQTKKGQKLLEKKGVEVGNIFQLGCHYTNLMKGALFTDKLGRQKPYYMGCYGIGVGRTLATVVEKFHDSKGIIWPSSIAPFKLHLIELGSADQKIKKQAQKLYRELQDKNISVLYDDRSDKKPGEKFADCDLIGIPYRLVISEKTIQKNQFEIKKRDQKQTKMIDKQTLFKILTNIKK
ncbi:MAG: proline--tRNA ligase [Candidatus Moranbacteria bacterium]|nr:proline--tRNA ligase [Candidatus Moranbacteria bacterium]